METCNIFYFLKIVLTFLINYTHYIITIGLVSSWIEWSVFQKKKKKKTLINLEFVDDG